MYHHHERDLVERFSGELQSVRAIATGYDMLVGTLPATEAMVCLLFGLN